MSTGSNKPPLSKVLLLFGPTASGKTDMLFHLFQEKASKSLPDAEVISADSMQVYRGMDIGTAKLSPDLRKILPHHLIDIKDPDEQFTVGEFVSLAEKFCGEIASRSRLPLVSGGTAFYLKNFINGLPESPPSDIVIREKVKKDLQERGARALVEELREADPESAERIHQNDVYRLTRALEVTRLSGRPLSSFNVPCERRSDFDMLCIGLERERQALYARIEERVESMFREGLPEEVESLVGKGYGPADPGLRAIGYREFFADEGSLRPSSPNEVKTIKAEIKTDSRRYAKRQMTFFRSLRGVEWFDAGNMEGIGERIRIWLDT